ncbi:sensor histidine kinase [Mahella sp.]|uniref:sensor histidine kinase n=1 Tax=Mahella sp. TaxID=2798721 RepID=UPI0025C65EFA|nr:sensor histidine kinase [Mahella sp.]MBZ4666180.1 sensor histidine kinase [Mahella sp.]
MQGKKFIYFKILMIVINLIAVLFVTIFIYITTQKICNNFIAREFINTVDALPWKPFRNIIISACLFGMLIFSFIIREFIYPNNSRVVYLTLLIDFITSIITICILNFNYNGILFLVMANIVTYTKGTKARYLLMLISVMGILIADYEMISINFKLYSINDYISFYDSMTQQYLLGFYNTVVSTNILIFIIYCIYVIQNQRGTIDEVNNLYNQLRKANEDLQKANEQLKEYSKITEKMGETKERNRLAREIHDTIGHTLTGISAGIDACITMVEKSPEGTKKQLEIISRVTREGINEIRRSVNKLRPDAIERLNLESAIHQMIIEIELMTNTHIYFESDVKNLKFASDEEDAIYRVIQESLTNAIRHGKATQIWVHIKGGEGEIILTVKDNGIGCKDMKKGFGTIHIMERIKMLNGTVGFDGTDGFTVTARIPIRWGEEYD